MNYICPVIAIILLLTAASSGCIKTETDSVSIKNEETYFSISDSDFFVTEDNKYPQIQVFEETIIENIISPSVLKNLGYYPQINYEMSGVIIPSGKENPPHILENTTETIYIISGEAEVMADGRAYCLVPGDILFIPENTCQEIHNSGEDELSYLSVTYPPYSEENEKITDLCYNNTENKNGAFLISSGNTTEAIFFDDVGIENLINPDILKDHGTYTPFKIGIAKARIQKGSMTDPHILEGTTEVMYILSGSGTLHVNKKSMMLTDGDTAYIPPGAYQSLVNSGDTDLIYLTITDPAYSESIDSSVSV